MAYQTVFERYELKYLLTREQKEKVMQAMEPHMEPDEYGRTVIRNIYFDTDTYRLVRRSIERPALRKSCGSAAIPGQLRPAPYLWN